MAVNVTKFPNWDATTCKVTSPPDPKYNCLAYAAGLTDVWWEPLDADGYFWPDDLPEDFFIDTLVMLYEGIGFDLCADGSLDPKMDKIALYVDDDDEGTHAAKQLPSGNWTSKLGPDDDIEHPRPETLAGGLYGRVGHFLERKRIEPETQRQIRRLILRRPNREE